MVEVHDTAVSRRNVAGLLLTVLFAFFCLALAGGLLLGWALLERGECGTGDYTLRDEWRVRTFALGVFGAPHWNETYATQPYHVMRTWLSETYNAVVFVDYLIYNCGHTPADLANYFSDESFKTQILKDYQEAEQITVCADGDTTLYVYTARLHENDYLTYTWVMPEGKYRVLDVFMAFPVGKQDVMSEYARRLFPNLPSCP